MRHSLTRACALAAIFAAVALAGCGTKGPLTRLPPAATQNTPASAPIANDLNTAKDPAQ